MGVTTTKASPSLIEVVHLTSSNNRYDMLYLASYAQLHVKDALARSYGVGDVQMFGQGPYSMRIWLDPEKLASRSMTPGDVVAALREQNVQVAAGQVGAPPAPGQADFQISVNTQGRLESEQQFGDIVVRAGDHGEVTHLRDVARVELGSDSYALRSLLDNHQAIALPIFQRPGTNALQMADDVRATMEQLKKDFPEGIEYHIVYDTTGFVHESINAVVHTLFEALILVVLVVILFLQNWRASIIPLAAVPVSLVGTFVILLAMGFGLNALTLFGLVLAIGIVVDDAIVVVENVERNIALGLSPVDATRKAMREVTGPIVSTALVLCAVFIPTAFITGLTGQFYRQFALTIAISTVISAFNSLTLSPALAAVLLRAHDAPKDRFEQLIDRSFGWLFKPFNRLFAKMSNRYVGGVSWGLGRSPIALMIYAGLLGLTALGFAKTPGGFVPQQDKLYLVGIAQLPDASTIDRTDAVIRKMSDIALHTPGVTHAVEFPGLSINGLINSPNSGIVFEVLDNFDKRRSPNLSASRAIAKSLNAQVRRHPRRHHRRPSRRPRSRAWARSAASACRSRTTPDWVPKRSTRRPRT